MFSSTTQNIALTAFEFAIAFFSSVLFHSAFAFRLVVSSSAVVVGCVHPLMIAFHTSLSLYLRKQSF
jgi:hypothetical protein